MKRLQDTRLPLSLVASDALTSDYSVDTTIVNGAAPPPSLDPSYPWLYFYASNAWQVYQGQVLPRLLPIKLVAGTNNISVRKNQRGQVVGLSLHAMLIEQRGRGRVMIPHKLGPNGRSYCKSVKGCNAYVDAWTTPISGSSSLRVDHVGKAKWLQSLIDNGHIEACPAHILEEMHVKKRRELTKKQDRWAKLPSGAGPIQRCREDLEVIKALLDERLPDAPAGDTEDFDVTDVDHTQQEPTDGE